MAASESAMSGGELETWLPVPGFESLYEISSNGQVRSMGRAVTARDGRTLPIAARLIRPYDKHAGSPTVSLWKDNRRTDRAVHVLMQQVFGVLPAMQPVPDAGEPERWLPVGGYEGLYEVSDLGRVRSFHAGRGKGKRGGLLRPAPTGVYAHLCVVLCQGGESHTRLVHHLVLEAFVGPRPDGMEALHGPGGALDNRLVNLSWGTKSENQGRDRVRDGTSNRGERQWQSKLTEADVIECRRRYAAGERLTVLVSEYGTTTGGMSTAISGKTWSWLPGAVPVDHKRHGRQGEAHSRAKLTAEIVLECRRRFSNGENSYALAREFGVAQPTMHAAIVGRSWAHV